MDLYEAFSDCPKVVDNKEVETPVESLRGTPVGVYFSAHWCGPCRRVTPLLAQLYEALRQSSKPFEIIFVSLDRNETAWKEYLAQMPWKAVPFGHPLIERLSNALGVTGIPTLHLFDADGKQQQISGLEACLCGPEAYPFSDAAIEQFRKHQEELKAQRVANQSLRSLLATADRDFVLSKSGQHVPVESLAANQIIGLYFSAHWCPPCRMFTPFLAQLYQQLRDDGKKFEVVFVSSDRNQAGFDEYFHEMPWLAVPYSDRETKTALSEHFDVQGIPTLILLDGNGKTVTMAGREVVRLGATAWPFTAERLDELHQEEQRAMENLPREVTIAAHPHPLQLLPSVYHGQYGCDLCGQAGVGFSYHCEACRFDAHPRCAK